MDPFRALDRANERRPVLVKVAVILIAFACLYFASDIDRGNDTALRLQMLTASRSAT